MKLSALPLLITSLISASGLLADDITFEAVPTTDVHLTDEFWLPIIQTVQDKTIAFALDKCIEEGRLENFLIAGGLMHGKTRGSMPFDDTDIYKIIEGASNSLLSSPDPVLEKQLEEIISIIAIGQEEDGYITTWRTIDPNHPPAPWVEPGPRWHHLAASHELYNAGHLFEAAATHYAATGSDSMLKIATGYADLLVKTFGLGKLETVPGHQIVETGLVKLYRITGKREYLELAKYFLDHRGDPDNHQLFGSYSQDHIPVTEQREVVGHAVRAVYMYAGMTDIAELYQDQDYEDAVHALWDNMTSAKLYLTGGIGARHEGEAFGDNYELPNLTAYAETCAAIGSVIWNEKLYRLSGDVKYIDLIERTLYNGLISGISLDGTRFFYPNCLEANGEFEFNHGNKTRSEWFDCSCCPSNLIRFLPTVPAYMYAQTEDTLAVNLYASNEARVTFAGTTVKINEQAGYPWNGDVELMLEPEKAVRFALKLRIPGWARNEVAPGGLYHYSDGLTPVAPQVSINGETLEIPAENGYVSIDRLWQAGDQVRLSLPMPVREVEARDEVADLQGQTALERGPFVYCLESFDNAQPIADISIDVATAFTPESSDILGGIVELTAPVDEQHELVAIPYYSWANRGVSSMKVWIPLNGGSSE